MERHKHFAAVYLILRQGDEVLLLRRFNTGYEDGKHSFVAGHIDAYESAEQALVREAKEEAGIDVERGAIELVHCLHRQGEDGSRFDLFFTASEWTGEPKNMEPDKCDELAWFPVDDLPETLIPYIRTVMDRIAVGTFYSEFNW